MTDKVTAVFCLGAGLFLLFASYRCVKSGEYGFPNGIAAFFDPVQRSENPVLFWLLVGLNIGMGIVGLGIAAFPGVLGP
jgi:hypothetical protein